LLKSDRSGFTLLEVIIAVTIMVMAFGAILSVESNSINATTRAREINQITMLARGKMVELEYKVEGKTFEEVRPSESGSFEPPYETYQWKTEIKEIKFPSMDMGGGGKEEGTNQIAEQLTKLLANFFTKAIREMVVTISYKRGGGDMSYSVSTYWVNLNQEFQTSE
jgi:prepilin-type N-terminal cleavage/methylation domain-containing protein